jgi:hypothetical protein
MGRAVWLTAHPLRRIIVSVARNGLADIDLLEPPDERPKLRRRKKMLAGMGNSKAVTAARRRERLPPVVPKNKSLSEIEEMDDHDEAFRNKAGRRPKPPGPDATWKELARWDKQQRMNARRAKVRKWEAKVESAGRVMEKHVNSTEKSMELYDDDKLIAEGMLDMADWSNEELIRGYKKSRHGRWGPPPKYIPREVQQAAFRQLVSRGDRRLKKAYYESIEDLIDLARTANSEKVKLEAIREVMNRVVGKVPDRVHIAQDQPWETVLADSLIPIGEALPLEMEIDDRGVAVLPPGDESFYNSLDDGSTSGETLGGRLRDHPVDRLAVDAAPSARESGGEVDATLSAAAATAHPAQGGKAPSSPHPPHNRRKKGRVIQVVKVIPRQQATGDGTRRKRV